MAISMADKIKVKWKRNAARASDNYEHFIKLVDVNPMELAAAQHEKWWNKLEQAKDTWKEIMSKIPREVWKRMVETLGVDNFRKGVEAKAFKVEQFAEKWASVYEAELNKIKALPATTPEQREKRMIENLKALRALKGKWR